MMDPALNDLYYITCRKQIAYAYKCQQTSGARDLKLTNYGLASYMEL